MRPSPGHQRPDHVIDIPDNQNPPEREQDGRAWPMIEHERDRPRPPHEPASQHGQDREHDRDYAPQRRVRESYHPETEARERAMERSRQTRADQRRRRDVAEALAQLFRVARGEWNVWADGVPRFPGPEAQVVEAEARDRQVQRHPRSRPDEPERGGPDPRHDLGAEVREPGAHIDPADPELGEPRDDGALHDGPWDPLRLADDQGEGGPADYNEHEENERHHQAGGSLSRRAAREPIVQWLECDVQDGGTDQP